MSVSLSQPTFGQVISILWFPFFLAVVMSVLFVSPLANPEPRDMRIGVVDDDAAVAELQASLDDAHPGGFVVRSFAEGDAAAAVRDNDLAAAVIPGSEPAVLIASATGGGRAAYLENLLPAVVDAPVSDILPSAAGDASGGGLFFYALPIAIVGMVSAIMLRQLVAWSYWRRCAAVVVIGGFTAVVTYAIAVWQQVIPAAPASLLLIPGAFVFLVALGWIITGVAEFVRQYLLPFALTFVLVLGVPTAGAPVTPDMLPVILAALHEVMPMGQFVALVRALAYGAGSPLQPTLLLLAWLTVGAAVSMLAARRHRHVRRIVSTGPAPVRDAPDIWGRVVSLAGEPVSGAVVRLIGTNATSLRRTETSGDGNYRLRDIPAGTHHILVGTDCADLELVPVTVGDSDHHRCEIVLDLAAEPTGDVEPEQPRAPRG